MNDTKFDNKNLLQILESIPTDLQEIQMDGVISSITLETIAHKFACKVSGKFTRVDEKLVFCLVYGFGVLLLRVSFVPSR